MTRTGMIMTGAAMLSLGSSVHGQPLPDKVIVSLEAGQALHFMEIGALSSTEHVEALIDRIEAHPEINAFIHLDEAQVLADAAEADALRDAGETLGPLHGLPVLIKDNIDTADAPTTAGTPSLVDNEPDADAPVVQALRDAGAIVLGKANMHELALGVTSNNAFTGAVRNPYDLDRIPGGSSGGNGAALAARFAPLAVGTDTGASVRQPAALTGTVALRPTHGRYSADGIVPDTFSFDTAGPMTRSVADAALLDSVLAGEPVGLEAASLAGLRIGAPVSLFRENLDPSMEIAMDDAIAALEAAGATIVEADIALAKDLANDAFFVVLACEYAAAFTLYLQEHDLDITLQDVIDMVASPDVAAGFEGAVPPPELCDQVQNEIVPLLKATYAAYLADNDLDAVVYPTSPLPAAPIGQDFFVELNGEQVPTVAIYGRNTTFASVVGAPAASLPMGLTDDGLPVGLEVMGAPGADRGVLEISAGVLQELGPIPAPEAIQPLALPLLRTPGDVDADGDADAHDLVALIHAFGSTEGDAAYIAEADLDGDGVIFVSDFVVLKFLIQHG